MLAGDADYRAIGSADEAHLIETIERLSLKSKRSGLRDVHLYIVAGYAGGERIKQALADSLATVVIIDPNQPIPQRPQVLARLNETEAAR